MGNENSELLIPHQTHNDKINLLEQPSFMKLLENKGTLNFNTKF